MSLRPDDSRPAPSTAGKPTLEDLLRLKRSERPDEAFWNEFDRGLRQKQLAAIVEPRPWWLGLSLLSRRLSLYGLPVSAAAAALFAFMIARTEPPLGQPAGSVVFAPSPAPLASVAAPSPSLAQPEPLTPEAAEPALSASPVVLAEATPVAEPATLAASEPESVVEPSALVPQELSAPATLPAPPLLVIAETSVAQPARALELAAVGAPESLPEAESRSEPAAAGNEAYSLKMVAFTPRHARVLLAMADNPEVQVTDGIAHLRDRMAHNLDREDSIYASASRLGVGGDRLSLSF